MKSIITEAFMQSIVIDRKTTLGREWDKAMEKFTTANQNMADSLKQSPELLKLFNEFDSAYDEELVSECTYFFHEGFRKGFFLAAELYGKKDSDDE